MSELVLAVVVALFTGVIAALFGRPFFRATVKAIVVAVGLTFLAGVFALPAEVIVPIALVSLVLVLATTRRKMRRTAAPATEVSPGTRVSPLPDRAPAPEPAAVQKQVIRMRVPTDQGGGPAA